MNQDKQVMKESDPKTPDKKPTPVKEIPAPKAVAAPSPPPPALPPPAKIEIDPAMLSHSLARDLGRLPRDEWARIESIACRVDGFARDMAEGVRFVDTIANVIDQQGGLFATTDLSKRRALEECSLQIVEAFRAFILATVQVARKRRLTNILERYWRLLSVYGQAPKAATADNGSSKSDAAKPKGDAATAA